MFQNRDDNVKYENQKLLTFCFKRVVWWSLLEVLITRHLLFTSSTFNLQKKLKHDTHFRKHVSRKTYGTFGRNYAVWKN